MTGLQPQTWGVQLVCAWPSLTGRFLYPDITHPQNTEEHALETRALMFG